MFVKAFCKIGIYVYFRWNLKKESLMHYRLGFLYCRLKFTKIINITIGHFLLMEEERLMHSTFNFPKHIFLDRLNYVFDPHFCWKIPIWFLFLFVSIWFPFLKILYHQIISVSTKLTTLKMCHMSVRAFFFK